MSGYFCDDWRPNVVTATREATSIRGCAVKRDWDTNAFATCCFVLAVTLGSLVFGGCLLAPRYGVLQ